MSTPWVEKYRPSNLDDVILSSINKRIIYNIIEENYFPNILFYGPPGTGKTTTVTNLINAYQKKYEQQNKELIIHLNASDERGVDIIRNQIQQFVKSMNMFNRGLKFVILDEVDYMTKIAQQALRHLMQEYNTNVRFCLICNYISKIDENLQNEFLKLRMNEIPQSNVICFLQNIIDKEGVKLTHENLCQIQKFYKSDIRSMVNYIQTNQDEFKNRVITHKLWENLLEVILTKSYQEINAKINSITIEYNTDKRNIVKEFLNYLIITKPVHVEFLDFVEEIIHANEVKLSFMVNFLIEKMKLKIDLKID